MEKVLVQFQAWGADPAGALYRLMGDMALYERLLGKFQADLAEDGLTTWTSCSGQEAFREVHFLKGAAANLGLLPLYDVLTELSAVLKEGGQVSIEAYQAYHREKERFFSIMKNLKTIEDLNK